ncbi:MAG: pilin [bacterium]|nr:pilin [bacterium]
MRKILSKALPTTFVTFPAFSSGNAPTADDAFNYLALMLNRGMYWLASFAFLIAGIMIIISGIKFMFAGGDEEKRRGARHTLIYSIVGVVVVILAQNFITVIKNFFGA